MQGLVFLVVVVGDGERMMTMARLTALLTTTRALTASRLRRAYWFMAGDAGLIYYGTENIDESCTPTMSSPSLEPW